MQFAANPFNWMLQIQDEKRPREDARQIMWMASATRSEFRNTDKNQIYVLCRIWINYLTALCGGYCVQAHV